MGTDRQLAFNEVVRRAHEHLERRQQGLFNASEISLEMTITDAGRPFERIRISWRVNETDPKFEVLPIEL